MRRGDTRCLRHGFACRQSTFIPVNVRAHIYWKAACALPPCCMCMHLLLRCNRSGSNWKAACPPPPQLLHAPTLAATSWLLLSMLRARPAHPLAVHWPLAGASVQAWSTPESLECTLACIPARGARPSARKQLSGMMCGDYAASQRPSSFVHYAPLVPIHHPRVLINPSILCDLFFFAGPMQIRVAPGASLLSSSSRIKVWAKTVSAHSA